LLPGAAAASVTVGSSSALSCCDSVCILSATGVGSLERALWGMRDSTAWATCASPPVRRKGNFRGRIDCAEPPRAEGLLKRHAASLRHCETEAAGYARQYIVGDLRQSPGAQT
jgi:hypothetical protein